MVVTFDFQGITFPIFFCLIVTFSWSLIIMLILLSLFFYFYLKLWEIFSHIQNRLQSKINFHVPLTQLQHLSLRGNLISSALLPTSLNPTHIIFKQIPQTIFLISYSLGNLTWPHSFKYPYAEDSQIYYLH